MDGGILGSLTHPKGLGSIFYEGQRNSQRSQGGTLGAIREGWAVLLVK